MKKKKLTFVIIKLYQRPAAISLKALKGQELRFILFKILSTRGHARFARSPLVNRLGDSRIRLGDSSYGEVLSSEWYYNYKIETVTLTDHFSTQN